MFFFFFKQKTAYELRISDWSSDVCSSDLHRTLCALGDAEAEVERVQRQHRRGRIEFDADPRLTGEAQRRGVGDDADVVMQRPGDPRQQIGRASCRERVCQYG